MTSKHTNRGEATPAAPLADRNSASRAKAEVFSALVRDKRVSHGAFRLWHVLYGFTNSRTGMSFPGRRLLQQSLHCSNSSLPRWTKELVANGWLHLTSKATRRGHRFIYTLLDGSGEVVLKAGPLSQNAKWSQKQDRSGPKSRTTVVPKVGTELIEPPKGGSMKRRNQELTARQPVPACAGPAGSSQQNASGSTGDSFDP